MLKSWLIAQARKHIVHLEWEDVVPKVHCKDNRRDGDYHHRRTSPQRQ